jgi:uncharacterized repeat protein (TIGR03803 family)
MRQVVFKLVVLLQCFSTICFGQKILGVLSEGATQFGSVYIADFESKKVVQHFEFPGTAGATPTNSECLLHQNKLYGTTQDGGTYGLGVIYAYDVNTKSYEIIYNFDSATGCKPFSGLYMYDEAQSIAYGVTHKGGAFDRGVIYKINLRNKTYVKQSDLNMQNGYGPFYTFTKASNGKLYLLCSAGGGALNVAGGAILEYDVIANNVVTKKVFTKALSAQEGVNPMSNFLYLNDAFYGTTYYGGANRKGVIFKYIPGQNKIETLASFDSIGCASATGKICAIGNTIYGCTAVGGDTNVGAVFSFNTENNLLKKIHSFDILNGRMPEAGISTDGKILFGVTRFGGNKDAGTIYTIAPKQNLHQVVFHFGETTSQPIAPLLIDGNNIYGNTNAGGISRVGTLFQVDVKAKRIQTLLNFSDAQLGANPTVGFTEVGGKYYSAASQGGSNNAGTIFTYDVISNKVIKLADFGDASGLEPNGELLLASDSNFYGICIRGGIYNEGTLYKFNIKTNALTKVKDFVYGQGQKPFGNLIERDKKIYGTAFENPYSSTQGGCIFMYDMRKDSMACVVPTNGTQGDYVRSGLLQTADNKIYATASSGGENYNGSLLQISNKFDTAIAVHKLNGMEGAMPCALPCIANDKFYFTCKVGGLTQRGTLVQFDLKTKSSYKAIDFNGLSIYAPCATSLFDAKSKNIFGTCTLGGVKNAGGIFLYNHEKKLSDVVFEFDYLTGAKPLGSLLLIRK